MQYALIQFLMPCSSQMLQRSGQRLALRGRQLSLWCLFLQCLVQWDTNPRLRSLSAVSAVAIQIIHTK